MISCRPWQAHSSSDHPHNEVVINILRQISLSPHRAGLMKTITEYWCTYTYRSQCRNKVIFYKTRVEIHKPVHVKVCRRVSWPWKQFGILNTRPTFYRRCDMSVRCLDQLKIPFSFLSNGGIYFNVIPKTSSAWYLDYDCADWYRTLIARFMGPKWGPSGADRTQVSSTLAQWTLLSGELIEPILSGNFQQLIYQLISRSVAGFWNWP